MSWKIREVLFKELKQKGKIMKPLAVTLYAMFNMSECMEVQFQNIFRLSLEFFTLYLNFKCLRHPNVKQHKTECATFV